METELKNKLVQVLSLLLINDHTSAHSSGLVKRAANRKEAIAILSDILNINEEDLDDFYMNLIY